MNKKNYLFHSAIAVVVLSTSTTYAAERQNLWDNNKKLLQQATKSSAMMLSFPATLLGLSADSTLEVRKRYRDHNGDITIRYQQLYKGIPVIGDDVILAHHQDNTFKRAHGSVVQGIAADVRNITPAFSAADALALAKKLSTPSLTAGGAMSLNRGVEYENEQSRLAIWQNQLGAAKLVYEVSFMRHGNEPSRPYYILDAISGDVLDHFDNLQTATASGPGGNKRVGRHLYGTDREHLEVKQSGDSCTMETPNVRTINLNHGVRGSTAFTFTCPENKHKEINEGYGPLNDAHYAGAVIYKMYQEWLGVPPLTFQLHMRVHYSTNLDNAMWDGRTMSFGDGYRRFYPLVDLNVASHEVAHGFTEQNSGLVYRGKSGGLNEAFSDMSGEAAEYYVKGTVDWMVGADITKAPGEGLRYMDNPPKDGKSIGHQSDYYSGMDVHHSSGVFNKAFYALATTAGWDVKKAFLVYAKANQQYWSATSNWDRAGNGVMDAACDLGYNTEEVKASLASVGVISNTSSGSQCGGGTPPPPTGELENGVPRADLSATSGNSLMFTMTVPAGASNIKFETSGGTGDADLYVKFGAEPTDSDYDCRSYSYTNNESCSVSQSGGVYHVRVKAWRSFSGVSLTGSYTQ